MKAKAQTYNTASKYLLRVCGMPDTWLGSGGMGSKTDVVLNHKL